MRQPEYNPQTGCLTGQSVMFKDKNNKEVTPKKWQWGVIMKDGTQIKQFENGKYTYISDINLDDVESFFVIGNQVFKMVVTPDVKIFKFSYLTKPYWDLKANLRTEVFGFKWRKSKHTVYVHILPNNNVIVSPHDKVDIVKELEPKCTATTQ